MRIAVFADVHGNYHALEATLEDIEKQNVDQVIIAGDLVNGLPDSKKCLDLINRRNVSFIRGNHERYVYDYHSPNAPTSWQSENFAPVRWVLDSLEEKDIEQLRSLPMYLQFENLLVTHSAPHDDYFSFVDDTAMELVEKAYADFSEEFVLRGHHHRWRETQLKKKYILTFNALGLPMMGKRETAYVIAEQHGKSWQFEKRFVDYDFEAALKSFTKTGYVDYTPMALLTKEELIRADAVVYPFVLAWNKSEKNTTLSKAIHNYLKTNNRTQNFSSD